MNEEQVRRRLMTTLSAAVRIGRSGGLTDSQVGAELQDLADLYLAATEVRLGMHVTTDKVVVGPPFHDSADWNNGAWPASVNDVVPKWVLNDNEESLRRATEESFSETAPAVCGFELPIYVDDVDGGSVEHVHRCQKAPGHADGPGGSDHQCESCGVLYDADGGTAAPLAMTGLPLGGNGVVPDAEEIEL